MNRFVEPLTGQCENYIVEHFEEFPVSRLSLLPPSRRKDLLWRLPIADVCLRLENTDFVKGLDMAAYWKRLCIDFSSLEFPKDSDIERYITERWPSEVEYAKARLYGQIATFEVYHPDDCVFRILPEEEYEFDDSLEFLYGVLALHKDQRTFPPRYQQVKKLLETSSWRRTKQEEQDIVDAIVNAFNGERPKMFTEIQLLADSDIHRNWDLSDAEFSLLSEVEYVGIQCRPFDDRSVDWISKLVNKAFNLQVLILQGCNVTNEYYDLDPSALCVELATCRPFLSTFRILKIVPGFLEEDELEGYGVDTPEKYTVLRADLNQLIMAYFSAPTNHSQLVQLSFTDVVTRYESEDSDSETTTAESQDVSSDDVTDSQDVNSNTESQNTNSDSDPPIIDGTYLQFKNIRLSDCYFDSNKATPEKISKWLGQEIKILEEDEETCSILFQIDDKDSSSSSVLGQKRKYCEVAEVTGDQVN